MNDARDQEELIRLLWKADKILKVQIEPNLVVMRLVRMALLWLHKDFILNHLDVVLGKEDEIL